MAGQFSGYAYCRNCTDANGEEKPERVISTHVDFALLH